MPTTPLMALASLLLVLTGGLRDTAECAGISLSDLRREADRILEGTITSVEQHTSRLMTVSVRVERVWKGPVTPEAVFYAERVLDAPNLTVGVPQIFFPIQSLPEEAARLQVQPNERLLLLTCVSTPELTPKEVRQLGRARIVKR